MGYGRRAVDYRLCGDEAQPPPTHFSPIRPLTAKRKTRKAEYLVRRVDENSKNARKCISTRSVRTECLIRVSVWKSKTGGGVRTAVGNKEASAA